MRSRAQCLVDKSLGAMLAGLEVYNKPDFPYREETFAVLGVNAWELLLKARIVQLDSNKMRCIRVREHRTNADGSRSSKLYVKRNRSGNPISVGLFKAHDRLVNDFGDRIDPAIRRNLDALVEIRDNAVHFFNKTPELERCVNEVAAATLKNFLHAVRQWFGVDLSRYNWFIMPLAFVRSTHTCEALHLGRHEQNLVDFVRNLAGEDNDASRDFNVALHIEVRMKRSKDAGAVPFAMSTAPEAVPVTVAEEDIRATYPWDYTILTTRLHKRYNDFKCNAEYHRLRQQFERDERYCKERRLDPGNPRSLSKKFYNPNILQEFDRHYTRV